MSRFFMLLVALVIPVIAMQAQIRMGIISDAKYCGEREVAHRIKAAGENLGWTVFLDETVGAGLQKIQGFDFVICLIYDNKHISFGCPIYLTLFHPFNYLDKEGRLLPVFYKYDGFLLTIEKPERFEENFKQKNKELFYIPFYPTIQSIELQENPLNTLMTMVPVWGNRRFDTKFKELYKLLDEESFSRFYGIPQNKTFTPKGYVGSLPFDGISVIKALQEHGVALIFHSEIHNAHGLPSARIFEAAAASAVIISDENPFVKKHFGDAVFYVDSALSAQELHQKICECFAEIRLNPIKALEMSRKVHEIYQEKFLMEDQLLRLKQMDEELKRSKS
jgi:hypothetical protein